jgi:hypothetical protein
MKLVATHEDNGPSKGREVQDAVIHTEHAIDMALAGKGELVAKILRASWAAGLPPARVQRALDLALKSLGDGVSMRMNAYRAHHELAEIMGELNLQELGWGDLAGSPMAIKELYQDTARPSPQLQAVG